MKSPKSLSEVGTMSRTELPSRYDFESYWLGVVQDYSRDPACVTYFDAGKVLGLVATVYATLKEDANHGGSVKDPATRRVPVTKGAGKVLRGDPHPHASGRGDPHNRAKNDSGKGPSRPRKGGK